MYFLFLFVFPVCIWWVVQLHQNINLSLKLGKNASRVMNRAMLATGRPQMTWDDPPILHSYFPFAFVFSICICICILCLHLCFLFVFMLSVCNCICHRPTPDDPRWPFKAEMALKTCSPSSLPVCLSDVSHTDATMIVGWAKRQTSVQAFNATLANGSTIWKMHSARVPRPSDFLTYSTQRLSTVYGKICKQVFEVKDL